MPATREIKTTITLDGVKKFDDELREAGRGLRVMGSEMKRAAAEFDAGGDRMAFLGDKSRILGNQIAQQETIIKALSRAVEESAAQYGDASARTDGYRIKLNAAQAALTKMQKELRDTDREMEEFGRDSQKVGRQIDDGITESAEEAKESLEDMVRSMQSDLGDLKGAGAIQAIGTLGNAITGTWTALDSFASENRDYNRQLSFLEQNAMTAGQDYEIVKGLLFDVAALTGDMDGAIEGVSNLLATGFDTDEAALAIQTLAGAVITFPETMKFENLAESLQETVKTGEATGAFSELLGRAGINVEVFNAAMKAARTEEEKQQVALSFLNLTGLRPVAESYKEVNEDLTESTRATLLVEDAWAQLARTIDDKLTPIKLGIADALTWINLLMTDSDAALKQAGEGMEALAEDITGREYTGEEFAQWMQAFSNNVLAGSGGLIGANDMSAFWGGFQSGAQVAGEQAGQTALDSAAGALNTGTDDLDETAKAAGENAMISLANGITTQGQTAIDAATAVASAINGILVGIIGMPSMNSLYNQSPSYQGVGGSAGASSAIYESAVNVSLNLDGKQIASATAPYTARYLGSAAGRAATYG